MDVPYNRQQHHTVMSVLSDVWCRNIRNCDFGPSSIEVPSKSDVRNGQALAHRCRLCGCASHHWSEPTLGFGVFDRFWRWSNCLGRPGNMFGEFIFDCSPLQIWICLEAILPVHARCAAHTRFVCATGCPPPPPSHTQLSKCFMHANLRGLRGSRWHVSSELLSNLAQTSPSLSCRLCGPQGWA